MKTSNQGLIDLAGLEGLCVRIYFDSVGVRTLGIGATVSELPNIRTMSLTDYHSIEELITLYKEKIARYEDAVNKALHVAVTQPQFDALVSLCYNIGTGGLARSTVVRDINDGVSTHLIANAFLLWNKPREILGRRQKEAHLFETGAYTNLRGMVTQTDTDGKGHERGAKAIDIRSYFL